GIVNGSGSAPMGTSSGVVVGSGAALQLQASPISLTTLARPLFLIGTGVNNAGALENLFGSITYFTPLTFVTSAITLLGNAAIGVDGGQLNIAGVMSGTGDLTKVGGGTLLL